MPRRETQHSYAYPQARSERLAASASPQSAAVNARRETAEQASISVPLEDDEQQ